MWISSRNFKSRTRIKAWNEQKIKQISGKCSSDLKQGVLKKKPNTELGKWGYDDFFDSINNWKYKDSKNKKQTTTTKQKLTHHFCQI